MPPGERGQRAAVDRTRPHTVSEGKFYGTVAGNTLATTEPRTPTTEHLIEAYGRVRGEQARAAFAMSATETMAGSWRDRWRVMLEWLRVIRDQGSWRDPACGGDAACPTFEAFFEARFKAPYGAFLEIAGTEAILRAHGYDRAQIDALSYADALDRVRAINAVEALDKADQRGPGRPRKETHNIVMGFPPGNTRRNALHRLRTTRPDLHARVLAGEISPHGAMLEAGFRTPTITVPLEPEAIARVLRRRLSADQLAALVAALTEE